MPVPPEEAGRHADRLHDLALAITRDRGSAAEIVRDVLVEVIVGPDCPTGDALLATLYARTRCAAVERPAGPGRAPVESRIVSLAHTGGGRTPGDLGAVAWAAMAGFSDTDQALITLHARHGLCGPDLAVAMGVADGAVAALLDDALRRVRRGIGALLVLRDETAPAAVEPLRQEWDGTFSPYVRGRVADALEVAAVDVPDPLPLLRVVPLVPAPAAVPEAVRTRLAAVEEVGIASVRITPQHDLDDTLPPGVAPLSVEDAPTIPPELAVPLPPPPPPAAPAPSPTPPASRRRHGPMVLSGALGAAAALVVAAVLAQAVVGRPAAQPLPPIEARPVPEAPAEPALPTPRQFAAQSARIGTAGAGPEPVAATAAPAESVPSAAEHPRLVGPLEPVEIDDEGTAVSIRNLGHDPVDWRVTGLPGWADASPRAGTVPAGGAAQLVVLRDPETSEGDHEGVVVVGSPGGGELVAVPVRTVVEVPPELNAIRLGARLLTQSGCGLDSTEIEVAAADDSGLAEVAVVVEVAGAAPTRTTLVVSADGTATGVLGPFQNAGRAVISVTATDARGNTATADAGALTIAPCPTSG